MKLLQNQKGFSAFEAVIVVIALVAIGAAGYFAYQARQDKTDYSVNVPKKTSKSEQQVTTTPVSYGDPIARLSDFYSQYLAEASSHRGDSGVKTFQSKGYINASFNGDTAGEPVLCGQEAVPDSVKVSLITKQSNVATLRVTKVYNDGSAASNSITAEMKPNSNNQWALSKVTCTK